MNGASRVSTESALPAIHSPRGRSAANLRASLSGEGAFSIAEISRIEFRRHPILSQGHRVPERMPTVSFGSCRVLGSQKAEDYKQLRSRFERRAIRLRRKLETLNRQMLNDEKGTSFSSSPAVPSCIEQGKLRDRIQRHNRDIDETISGSAFSQRDNHTLLTFKVEFLSPEQQAAQTLRSKYLRQTKAYTQVAHELETEALQDVEDWVASLVGQSPNQFEDEVGESIYKRSVSVIIARRVKELESYNLRVAQTIAALDSGVRPSTQDLLVPISDKLQRFCAQVESTEGFRQSPVPETQTSSAESSRVVTPDS